MGKYSSVGIITNLGDSKKRTRRTRIDREDRPGVAGFQTEHWSGRIDAVAIAPQAKGVGGPKPKEG